MGKFFHLVFEYIGSEGFRDFIVGFTGTVGVLVTLTEAILRVAEHRRKRLSSSNERYHFI